MTLELIPADKAMILCVYDLEDSAGCVKLIHTGYIMFKDVDELPEEFRETVCMLDAAKNEHGYAQLPNIGTAKNRGYHIVPVEQMRKWCELHGNSLYITV